MEPARILIIEDNHVDALCIKESLGRAIGTNFATAHVETLAEAKERLEKEDFDALILDLGLPDRQGIETLVEVQDSAPATPIVVLSGLDDEALALEAVRKGAQDYVLKSQCNESYVPRVINFAIERLKREKRTVELSKANQRLREEVIQREQVEAVLRSILEASPIGIGLTEDRILKWANEAWMQMFGFDRRDEFVGKNSEILYASREECDRVGNMINESLGVGSVLTADVAFKRVDGSLFDGHLRVKSFQSPDFPHGAISTISDVPDKTKVVKILHEGQERLQLALAGADLGWWELNVQTRRTLLDDRAGEILGYAPDEAKQVDRLWEESVNADDKPGAVMALESHLRGETASFESEHRVRTKSGEWKWISVRGKIVERDAEDKPLRLAGTFLDVTESKKTKEALAQSERRFRAIFEEAEDYIFLKDRSLRFTQVNQAFEMLVGVPASEIIGKRYDDLFGEETSDLVRDMDLRVLAGETIEDEHTKTVRGIPMSFLATRNPLRDPSGEIVGILVVMHDITDRKREEVHGLSTEVKYPSRAMRTTLAQASTFAKKASTVLLTGESGSGKDHLAQYIHSHSDRAGGPYFSINCAAISPTLAESELFGHEKGSFTGALTRKRGLLELAQGGTLLLNEIGDLSLPLQAKLLTFLDTNKFTRVGGEKEISVNARLIAATNKHLEKAVEEGAFRKDLFYRINVVSIRLPPLRDRLKDIPILAQEILAKIREEMQIDDMPVVGQAAMEALKGYHWPGNVRELRNVLERALILSRGKEISPTALGLPGAGKPSPQSESSPQSEVSSFSVSFPVDKSLKEMTQELKRFLVNEALRTSSGHRQRAAELLGISRDSLKHHMKKLGYEEEG